MHVFGVDAFEIVTALASPSIDGEQLNTLVAEVSELDRMTRAFRSPSTRD